MNGVRRLLGAATGASPPLPDKDLPSAQPTPPLVFAKSHTANWPPQSPSASPKQTSFTESLQSTAAIFLGKKDKSRPPLPEEEVTVGSPYSTTRTLNGSTSHAHSPPHSLNNHSPAPSRSNTLTCSTSVPSSPLSSNRAVTRKSVGKQDGDSRRSSGFSNTRDELLFSLLASEAVADCRDFSIIGSEEVEDLKKEQQVLNARLVAMKKRLHLETKIRDAALSLSKVNSSNKRLSKQTDEQLDAARRRVDTAQTEYWSLSERANEIHRKLLEHRAGVLSHFVRSMEKKMGPSPSSYDSGFNSNRSTVVSTTRTSTTVSSTGFTTPKFDGAHFFAGHVDAIVPKKILSPEVAALEISALEIKLKAATEALAVTKKQQDEMARELSLVKLEKQEAETMMGLELQTAEDTISALEKELPRLEGLDSEVQELLKEKERWAQEKERLEEQNESLRARIASLETRNGEANGAEQLLAEVRGESQRLLEEKESEIEELQSRWEAERVEWEEKRAEWEEKRRGWQRNIDDLQQLREELEEARDENETTLQKVNQELDEGLSALQQMIREHGIVLFSRETSLKGLLEATSSHLQTVHSKLEGYGRAEADWSIAKRKLEEDVRIGLDKREMLTKELEDARRAYDFAKRETRTLQQQQDSARSSPIMLPKSLSADISVSPDADVNKLIAALLPVWAILPSPEARAAKFGSSPSRKYRTGSETGSPLSSNAHLPGVSSLSDLDVRSLKSLYNGSRDGATGSPRTPGSSASGFSIEAFVQRVQALVADDKALIERLVRFAQAHDLLKKNAERAQKLAQEGNLAMETYQKQVKILEERNMGMNARIAAMQEEWQHLHDTIERLTAEKQQIESLAAEQAETCRQLTDANNVLSARTLTLAEEAASAPEMVRRQLETQIADLKKQLEKAEVEIEEMKTAAQTQRAALFEEMNTMNEENTHLRAQLRATKK